MKPFALFLIALVIHPVFLSAQAPSFIRLQEMEGRTWLVDSSGRPFFAHGVTHVAYGHNNEDITTIGRLCKELGFNAYGYGCPEQFKSDLPYVDDINGIVKMAIYQGTAFSYIDIFDPAEQERIENLVRWVCLKNKDNPNLIGYFWTDMPAWSLNNRSGTNWVEFIRSLPDGSSGKQEYDEFLKTWKGTDTTKRDLAFLKIIAREYFRVCGEANRKYDPHHLIFGDRFDLSGNIVPEVLEEATAWVDAIAVQPPFAPGFPKKDYEQVHRLTGKPIIISDFAIPFKEEGKKVLGWKVVESPKIAGERYTAYMKEALSTSYIIGSFWCNPVTQLKPRFYPPGFVKQGLYREGLKPRPELHRAIRELNDYLKQKTPKGALRRANEE